MALSEVTFYLICRGIPAPCDAEIPFTVSIIPQFKEIDGCVIAQPRIQTKMVKIIQVVIGVKRNIAMNREPAPACPGEEFYHKEYRPAQNIGGICR